jgi:hypothetical protein
MDLEAEVNVAGYSNLYLKLTAPSQDATDTGTPYECSVSFP